MQTDAVSKSNHSDDEEDCTNCDEAVSDVSSSIRCDICKNMYHQACTGYSEEVFTVLSSIISQTGWVCWQCRIQVDCLKSSLVKVTEELADLRASLATVIAEVQQLKNTTSKQELASSDHTRKTTPAVSTETWPKPGCENGAPSNKGDPVTISQIRLEFHRTYQDVTRRKRNVVVSGIPEPCTNGNTDKEADNMTFVKFCEEQLSVKPPLAHNGCVRLEKSDGVRPRRLLVHLTSETSAANLLNASKALRRNEDPYIASNVYINPDLSQLEAKLAYEKRVQRRRHRQAQVAMVVNQRTALSVNAEPYVAHTADLIADSHDASTNTQHPTDEPSRKSDLATNAEQMCVVPPPTRALQPAPDPSPLTN